jgi:hypothetical protein
MRAVGPWEQGSHVDSDPRRRVVEPPPTFARALSDYQLEADTGVRFDPGEHSRFEWLRERDLTWTGEDQHDMERRVDSLLARLEPTGERLLVHGPAGAGADDGHRKVNGNVAGQHVGSPLG